MESGTIRDRFVRFFEEKGHLRLPSASLVPRDDPSLLFTTAGMLPLVPYFVGRKQPPARRIVTVQKCFRTTDLEDVGDTYHHTFFEMLGNFAIGDYWKREAIVWGWEFATKWLGIPEARLVGTVHADDEEAYRVWTEDLGLPPERVFRLSGPDAKGEEQNFWSPGPVGPCGPCSELQYDNGPRPGWDPLHACGPGHECNRYLELWNYVFQQYDRRDGELVPLPMKNIDTGMGLERISQVTQDVRDDYETDLFTPIIARIAELAEKPYGADADATRSMRVIADHARGMTFLIADGIQPSNEWRGYVLRRLIRRAAVHGRLLRMKSGFLPTVSGEVIKLMQRQYHELTGARDRILETVRGEEERFERTLSAGLQQLEAAIEEAKASGRAQLDGKVIFRLYDTFGFPRELTREIATTAGVSLDEAGFERALETQRTQSRQAAKFATDALRFGQFYTELRDREGVRSKFVGYDALDTESRVQALLLATAVVAEAAKGTECQIVLDTTPFYPEGGGQVGDAGELLGANGRALVTDTQEPAAGVIVHSASVIEGTLRTGDVVTARVDAEKRHDTMRNHTATHMLHAAVRRLLGDSVHQAGSLVEPARLRFDFTYDRALTPEQLATIEEEINRAVLENRAVRAEVMPLADAIATGALALFDEHYGDQVRVMTVEDFSKELCGGTHVGSTGEIGLFVITREESVGAGMRRIEALTGRGALRHLAEQRETLGAVASQLKVPRTRVVESVTALQDAHKKLERELGDLERQSADAQIEGILHRAALVDGARVVAAKVNAKDLDHLRAIGDRLRDRLGSGVILLGTVVDGRAQMIAVVTKDLVSRVNAKQLAELAGPLMGGKGGGRAESATAGGREVGRLNDALEAASRAAQERLRAGK